MSQETKQARIIAAVIGIICLVRFFGDFSSHRTGWMLFDLSGAVIILGLVAFRWKSS